MFIYVIYNVYVNYIHTYIYILLYRLYIYLQQGDVLYINVSTSGSWHIPVSSKAPFRFLRGAWPGPASPASRGSPYVVAESSWIPMIFAQKLSWTMGAKVKSVKYQLAPKTCPKLLETEAIRIGSNMVHYKANIPMKLLADEPHCKETQIEIDTWPNMAPLSSSKRTNTFEIQMQKQATNKCRKHK